MSVINYNNLDTPFPSADSDVWHVWLADGRMVPVTTNVTPESFRHTVEGAFLRIECLSAEPQEITRIHLQSGRSLAGCNT